MDKSISDLRADFPILDQRVNDEPLVYLDNAATAQRPTPVLKQVLDFYQTDNANVHRGVHTLAERQPPITKRPAIGCRSSFTQRSEKK